MNMITVPTFTKMNHFFNGEYEEQDDTDMALQDAVFRLSHKKKCYLFTKNQVEKVIKQFACTYTYLVDSDSYLIKPIKN